MRYFSVDKTGQRRSREVAAGPGRRSAADDHDQRATAATCSTGWYDSTVPVDTGGDRPAGGSGVAATYYTTDGSTPTTASTRYTTAFTSPDPTVKYFSVDTAGNAEAVKSQLVQIDGAAPTTTIACNGTRLLDRLLYAGTVSITLAATDPTGGSGVAATYYTTDGSTPTTSST